MFPVKLGNRSYDVLVSAGALDLVPRMLERACPAARYAMITDETVAGLYGRSLAERISAYRQCDVFQFPPGESHKTRHSWSALTDAMLSAGIGRDGAIVAVGGGVVGDVAGFVAATYMRGIPYIQVPTTLLAMVDSSTGGKTGVDTIAGKNLVGAFHQPAAVICDPNTLTTLPARELGAGAAEAVKHGAIADRAYCEFVTTAAPSILRADPTTLTAIVAGSVRIKAETVSADEREQGVRAILNFGHTMGHAIEAAAEFQMLHGEAVAAGMVFEARLGEGIGITDPGTATLLANGLRRLNLPVEPPSDRSAEALIAMMRLDKKNREGEVRFSLIDRLGKAHQTKTGNHTVSVPESLLQSHLGEAG